MRQTESTFDSIRSTCQGLKEEWRKRNKKEKKARELLRKESLERGRRAEQKIAGIVPTFAQILLMPQNGSDPSNQFELRRRSVVDRSEQAASCLTSADVVALPRNAEHGVRCLTPTCLGEAPLFGPSVTYLQRRVACPYSLSMQV